MNLSQMGSFLVGLDSCSCVRRAEHERREEAKKLGPVGDLIVLMVTTIDESVCRRPYVSLRFWGLDFRACTSHSFLEGATMMMSVATPLCFAVVTGVG